MLQLYKEEADHIRKEIDVMMNVLIEKTEVVQDDLHVETRKEYKQLKGDIKKQRDENEILYKDLKKIVIETKSQQSKISIFSSKIEELEQHVGILANSADPYWNQIPETKKYDHPAKINILNKNFDGVGSNTNISKDINIVNTGLNSDQNLRNGSSIDYIK